METNRSHQCSAQKVTRRVVVERPLAPENNLCDFFYYHAVSQHFTAQDARLARMRVSFGPNAIQFNWLDGHSSGITPGTSSAATASAMNAKPCINLQPDIAWAL